MAGEVATAWVTLLPSFKGGSAAISREIDPHLTSAGASGSKKFGSAFTGGLKGIGAGIVAAIGIGVVTDTFSDLVGGASDLNETISKSNTIFGDNAGAVQKWAEDSAKNLGLPKQAALDIATNFGNMFQQLGFAGTDAVKMSKGVAELSADLGSFNNLPTQDVADRIGAAFRGEYDSLQLLIPNINAARVEQEAMAATGKTNAKELTAQEKAAAVLAIVQKDGAAAMGDFAKTSDGAANKGKILSARFADLKSSIGQKLLPIFDRLLDFGGKIIDFFSGAGKGAGKFSDILSTARKVIGKVFGAVAGFVEDNRDTFEAWGKKIGEIFTGIRDLVVAIVGRILEFWEDHGARIMATVSNVWDRVKAIIGAALDIIKGVIGFFIDVFTGDWSGAWDNVLKIVGKAWDLIKNLIGLSWDLIKGIIMTALSTVWDWISGKFGELVEWVKGLPARLLEAGAALWQWISDKAGEIKDDVIAAVATFFGWVASLPTQLKNLAGEVFGWFGTKAAEVKDNVVRGLIEFYGWIRDLPETLKNLAGDVWGWLVDAAKTAAREAWEAIKNQFNPFDGRSGISDELKRLKDQQAAGAAGSRSGTTDGAFGAQGWGGRMAGPKWNPSDALGSDAATGGTTVQFVQHFPRQIDEAEQASLMADAIRLAGAVR